jgi:hypothetical protein
MDPFLPGGKLRVDADGADRSWSMEQNVVSLPDIEKISGLVSAIAEYAVKSARDQWAREMSPVYHTPRIRCWDECAWYELAKDRQIVNYLLSDLSGAWILTRSLHFCMQWHGQAEINRLQGMEKGMETK